jgi:hypothetical protein
MNMASSLTDGRGRPPVGRVTVAEAGAADADAAVAAARGKQLGAYQQPDRQGRQQS